MTVSLETVSKSLACDGASKTFLLAGLIYLTRTDLRVFLLDEAGAATEWTLGDEYNLAGDGTTGGGSLTTTATEAYANGYSISVLRDTDDIQNEQLNDGDGFPAKNMERAFDRRTLRSQELDYRSVRTLRASLFDVPLRELSSPRSIASRLLSFDDTGQPETIIQTKRLALAPDGDTGPSIPPTTLREWRLPIWNASGDFDLYPGAPSQTSIVTTDPTGKVNVIHLPLPEVRAKRLFSFDEGGDGETPLTMARLALAPDGDKGPSIPDTETRAKRLSYWDADANFAPLPGLPADNSVVTLLPDGQIVLVPATGLIDPRVIDYGNAALSNDAAPDRIGGNAALSNDGSPDYYGGSAT